MKNLQSIMAQTFSYLKENLDAKLSYHSVEHTQWVLQEITHILEYCHFDTHLSELLKIAAICHDCGYTVSFENNEVEGAKYAEKIMLEYGYNYEDIVKVKSWILETNLQKAPSSIESSYLRDADSGYIGTGLFKPFSDKLYKEYVALHKISGDRKEWNQIQIEFFENHRYYSSFSKLYRQQLKENNLNLLKNL